VEEDTRASRVRAGESSGGEGKVCEGASGRYVHCMLGERGGSFSFPFPFVLFWISEGTGGTRDRRSNW
jgi:hypothetical protein